MAIGKEHYLGSQKNYEKITTWHFGCLKCLEMFAVPKKSNFFPTNLDQQQKKNLVFGLPEAKKKIVGEKGLFWTEILLHNITKYPIK